ncbi:MAG: nucleoside transporter C-terminal domain-containing protein, partial [bacterium]
NIFVGIESSLAIRPYLERMTRSELHTILTAMMATIASSVLGLYVIVLQTHFPTIAGHLVSATVLSAPASLVISKLMLPESEKPETLGRRVKAIRGEEPNAVMAVLNGAQAGGRMVWGIIVLLVAVLGLVGLVNLGLGELGKLIGGPQELWTLEGLLSYIGYPLALIIGVDPQDALPIGKLIGERAILTELKAYQDLNLLLAQNILSDPRSAVLASYALCGFTHIASLAIFVGGISALVPHRTSELARIGFRALIAATLACLMTACVAGIFWRGETFPFNR